MLCLTSILESEMDETHWRSLDLGAKHQEKLSATEYSNAVGLSI